MGRHDHNKCGIMSIFYSICVLIVAGLQNKVGVNRLDILRLWDLMLASAPVVY